MESTGSDLSDWECRTFGNIQLKSPPMVHHDDLTSDSDNPHLPSRQRNYGQSLDTGDHETKNKGTNAFHLDKENIPTKWNNSWGSRDRDSALGGSLISAYGSVLTDSSSSFDGQSNSENETISNVSSPTHSTYGRYRKIYGNESDSTETNLENGAEEVVVLHRLPGENLGMILGIEGDKTKDHISTVRVKSVTIGGAAYRASGSSSGIAVGDEILEVNGLELKTLSHDECVTVFKEMPLRVILKIKRKMRKRIKSAAMTSDDEPEVKNGFVMRYTASESEDDVRDGFIPLTCEIDKNPKESLGLSIVPSYGSTRQFYQIKRLLPSGAASRSRKLKVGDRLVSCNGINLAGVNQSKCLSILKSEANNGDFEIGVLRPVDNDIPTEFSLTVTNGHTGETNLILKSPKLNRKFEDNLFDTEGESEVVLNSFQNSNNLFASNKAKLLYQKPNQTTQYSSDQSTDLDSSFETRDFYQKERNSKMASSEDPWSFALPPPAEFSDQNQDKDDDEKEDQVPAPTIDDVLNEYSPTCSNMSTPIHQPSGQVTDMKMIEALVGLEEDRDVSEEFPLTQIDESPLEQSNTVDRIGKKMNEVVQNDLNDNQEELVKENDHTNYTNTNGDLGGQLADDTDSKWLPEQNDIELKNEIVSEDLDTKPKLKSKNYFGLVGKVHRFYYNSSDSLSQTESGDDDMIQPIKVKKELSVPDYLQDRSKTVITVVNEETITPSAIERDNKIPVSARFDVNSFVEVNKEERCQSEDILLPQKSSSPPLPDMNKDRPPKSHVSTKVEFDGEEIVETFVPIKAKREDHSKILEEKLGNGIEEETIVRSEIKRDNSFGDHVQTIMIGNKLAKSVKEKTENYKSIVTLSGSVQSTEIFEKHEFSDMEVDNARREEELNGKGGNSNKVDPLANEISVTIPMQSTHENEGANEIGGYKTEISVKVQNYNNSNDNLKNESELDAKVQKVSEHNVTEKSGVDITPTHKTTVSVTSTLNTQGSSSPTSSTIKPLTTIKPLSFSSLSLNRPNKYKSVIDTGSKPSLLSTIYSKTHAISANVRSETEEFQVNVMKGILGIGMKVEVKPEGYVQVTEIQSSGPVGKDGNIRVGDYILSINSTEVTGLPDHKVQQIIRLLPRGLAKIVVSVTPPDLSKIDMSTRSRPSDLSINTSIGPLRRLTPALSPKSFDGRITSPGAKPSSPTVTKHLPPSLSPSHHSPLSSPPANQGSPKLSSPPKSPGLSPALAPKRSPLQQTPPKPLAVPRHTVTQETVGSRESSKPLASPRKPVEDGMTIVKVTGTKKEPPPVAPKPKPRPLPQQTETATHHKITPSIGGYVGSAMSQLKKSHEQTPKESIITPHHTDYVSSARRAGHETDKTEPIDTVIFASVSPDKQTDYVSSAMKSEEPKLIPSGVVDFVSKEKPKVAERSKPAHFQVIPPTGNGEGGVKIAPVRLNSALSPRKSKSPDNTSFNFNANYSFEEKALPRTGYFVGKTDVVTSPNSSYSLHDEEVSVPPIPSPRSDKSESPRDKTKQVNDDNSLHFNESESPRDKVENLDLDMNMSQRSNQSDSTRNKIKFSPMPSPRSPISPRTKVDTAATEIDSKISPLSQFEKNITGLHDDVVSRTPLDESHDTLNNRSEMLSAVDVVPTSKYDESEVKQIDLESNDLNINLSEDSVINEKQLSEASGVGLETEIIADCSVSQETLPNINGEHNQSDMHGELNNLYMHEGNIPTNTDEIDSNKISEESESNQVTSDFSVEQNGLGSIIDSSPLDACFDDVIKTCELSGEGTDFKGESSNQNVDVQLISDTKNISFEQELQGSGDQQTSAIVEVGINVSVNKDYVDSENIVDDTFIGVSHVPAGFGDDPDKEVKSDDHHQQQNDIPDSANISDSANQNSNVPFPSYCVKFPPIDTSDNFNIVSSHRPFSIISGLQKISVLSKSNSPDDVLLCDMVVSTTMLSCDLRLANQKMDSLGKSIEAEISVILLQRESSKIPIGLNLRTNDASEDLIVSSLDTSGLLQQSGHIKVGDSVLLIDGEVVNKDNVVAIFQSVENSESQLVCVVISPSTASPNKENILQDELVPALSPTSDENANKRISNVEGASKDNLSENTEECGTEVSPDGIIELTMVKGVTGLGFLIEGGLGSPRGDVPVKIKRMFKGGAAAKCGLLQVGDELVMVNGTEMATMKHTEAWNFLKFLDDGDVKLTIRRAPN